VINPFQGWVFRRVSTIRGEPASLRGDGDALIRCGSLTIKDEVDRGYMDVTSGDVSLRHDLLWKEVASHAALLACSDVVP
jgi:hypothetical protein